jgi:hypothetical protein
MFATIVKGNDEKLVIHTNSNLSSHSDFKNQKDDNNDHNSLYVNQESFGDSTLANKSAKEKEKDSGTTSEKDRHTQPDTKETAGPENIRSQLNLIEDSWGSSKVNSEKKLKSTPKKSGTESWDIPDEAGIPPDDKKQFMKKATSDNASVLNMDVAEVGLPLSEPNGEEAGKTESESTEETGEEDEEASDESDESEEENEGDEEDEGDSDYDSDDYTDAEQSTENDILGERVLPPEFLKEVNKLSFEIYEMNEKGHIGKVDCENSKNAAVKNQSQISGIAKADQTLAKNPQLLSHTSSEDYTSNFLLDTTQNYSMSLQVDQQRIFDLDNFHDLSDLKSFLLMTSYRQSTTSKGGKQYSDPKPNPDKLL